MKKTIGFMTIWLGLAAVAWMYLLPRTPSSSREWFLLLVAGPPAFILASLLFEGLGSAFMHLPGIRHARDAAERRSEGTGLSGLRVLTYLGTSLVGIGIALAVVWVWHGH